MFAQMKYIVPLFLINASKLVCKLSDQPGYRSCVCMVDQKNHPGKNYQNIMGKCIIEGKSYFCKHGGTDTVQIALVYELHLISHI